jgi:Protein of unknown function (DUF1559)
MFFAVTCSAVVIAAVAAVKNERPFIVFGLFFAVTLSSISAFVAGRCRAGSRLAALSFLLLCLGMGPVVGGRRFINTHDAASKNNLRQIGEALMLYAAVNHELPSAFTVHSGTPLYSWRGMILSQIGRQDLQQQLRVDEPWNGPNNSAVANKSVGIYWSPSSDLPDTMTSYLAVVGRHSAIGESPDVPNSLDYIAKHGVARNLIMVIEVPNSGINWLEPRDLTVDQLKQNGLRGLIPASGSAPHPDGFNVLFANGRVETLPVDIDPEKLAPMLEIDPIGRPDK